MPNKPTAKLARIVPTHWMDDRGYVVTNDFLKGPRSNSDWRMAYCYPCTKKRGKIIRLDVLAKHSAELSDGT